MKKYDEATYSAITSSDSLANRLALMVRKKMYAKLIERIDLSQLDKVLDVGVTSEKENIETNFFEAMFPFPEKITAFSDQDALWMEEAYVGLKFVRGDGRDMPFEDGEFDLVFSSAVIEHVGSYLNQRTFIKECMRVSKRYIFFTTPNRWHPLEFHSAIPLAHWLPKKMHRKLLWFLGLNSLALEENLNLLTRNELESMLAELNIKKYEITSVTFLGFPSNLLVFIAK